MVAAVASDVQRSISLSVDAPHCHLVTPATGTSKAKELIFTAARVDAVRALELGMVNAIFDAGQAEKGALSMAGDMARRGPLAVRAAKLAIDEGLAMVSKADVRH